jgi:hypothetical protein
MKIGNVHVRVEKTDEEGFKADEVFVTCSEPYMNFVIQLRNEFTGKIAGGIYSLEFVPFSFPEPKVENVEKVLSGQTKSKTSEFKFR